MNGPETAALIRSFLNGDEEAFSTLVNMHQARIFHLAFNYVKDEEEARDLTQDIFVTVYRSLKTLRDPERFGSWLYQLALNHCRNRYKRLKRRGFFASQTIDDPERPLHLSDQHNPEKDLDLSIRRRLVREAISELRKKEKEILLLRDIQEFSYEEISEILGVPVGTVKSKLNRARHALKDKLRKKLLLQGGRP